MVWWGAIWGAVLGLLWPGHDNGAQLILGALLGALAGWSLRHAVRKELGRHALQRAVPAPSAEPAAADLAVSSAPAPAAAAEAPAGASTTPDFADTHPGASLPRQAPTAPPPPPTVEPSRPGLGTAWLGRARGWLFGGNTVVRMGVLVLFVGLAFLAKYAVDQALLPPQLRLAAIGATGIALFIAGLRLRGRRPGAKGYAVTLQGAGVAVLYLTVFAAFRLYQFLPAGAAFAVMGLVCLFSTLIALAQNTQALAFIGFAGAFAAPVLVSTGSGSHVGLFSYYALLGVAIAAIAWLRAWRPLNLLGFLATFGVATVWGVLRYQPEQLATTEPFLIGFFAIYLAASLFYALRHGQAARKAVDATLIFGTPIVAFGLQAALMRDTPLGSALSALALGAVYVALGWWLLRRRGGDAEVHRWLAESFAALALGFITLAVPLALDGRWTAAVWAVEGAGVYWMGRRQGRWLARAAGLALQAFAAVAYLDGLTGASQGHWPLANPGFLGAAMLAGAALGVAWWSRSPTPPDGASPAARSFAGLEGALTPLLFWLGFLWWQGALGVEIERRVAAPDGGWRFVFEPGQRTLLHLLGWLASAWAAHRLARPERADPWPVAATPAWLNLPWMALAALSGMADQPHLFASGGWVGWPVALALHVAMLRGLDTGRPARWWPWVHAGGVWLLVLLAGNLLLFGIGRAQLWQTAWATVVLLVAGSLVLLALARQAWFDGLAHGTLRWPLDRFARAYLWLAAGPLAIALALGTLGVAVRSDGNAHPLPYVPLLNPTDLAVGLGLAASTLWLLRLRASGIDLPPAVRGIAPPAALGAIAFVALNTVWLRVAHHFAAVPWNAHSLSASFLVQAGYSILWTLLALVLMIAAHRRALRLPWMLGAGLLGLTVLKLFVIDLSNSGGSERIVAFIAVGVLMLVVGWFAPLPPGPARSVAGGSPPLQEGTP